MLAAIGDRSQDTGCLSGPQADGSLPDLAYLKPINDRDSINNDYEQ